MDESGHRENGRSKPEIYKSPQSQWLMQHQPSMKQIMSIIAERDAAIQERNMALNDKNKALEERDMVIMQRDTAIQERNEAIMERDHALAALQHRHNIINSNNNNSNSNSQSCPPGCQIGLGVKHVHHPHQHLQPQMGGEGEPSYDATEVKVSDIAPLTILPPENLKSQKGKRQKEPKPMSPNKKSPRSSKKVKRELNDADALMPQDWKGITEIDGDEYKQLLSPKSDWKNQDLGLNQLAFDDTTMPPPVCSCTGVYRQCYKWGNGGWQSACCTTTMSMYPLPAVPNKRHARVGGRKMSGGAFSKLLSRLSVEGHDLSVPVDLKDHWAKHGTNRYITIK